MSHTLACSYTLLFVFVLNGSAFAQEAEWNINTYVPIHDDIKRETWQLCLINEGQLRFFTTHTLRPAPPDAPPLPVDCIGSIMRSDEWWQGKDYLRIHIERRGRDRWPAHAEKYGWYLAVDYSVDQPQLKLEKEAEKKAAWFFDDASMPSPEGRFYFVRTVHDGKDAWLRLPEAGKQFNGGYETRMPVLTFEKEKRSLIYFEPPSL